MNRREFIKRAMGAAVGTAFPALAHGHELDAGDFLTRGPELSGLADGRSAVASIWFAPEYLDLSDALTRRQFIDRRKP